MALGTSYAGHAAAWSPLLHRSRASRSAYAYAYIVEELRVSLPVSALCCHAVSPPPTLYPAVLGRTPRDSFSRCGCQHRNIRIENLQRRRDILQQAASSSSQYAYTDRIPLHRARGRARSPNGTHSEYTAASYSTKSSRPGGPLRITAGAPLAIGSDASRSLRL